MTSNFGLVCTLRLNTPCENTVISLLYFHALRSLAIKWGCEHESIAIQKYKTEYNLKVKSRFYLSIKNYPHLGASPDGLFDDNIIIEVNCPVSSAKLIPMEVFL